MEVISALHPSCFAGRIKSLTSKNLAGCVVQRDGRGHRQRRRLRAVFYGGPEVQITRERSKVKKQVLKRSSMTI